MQRVIQPRMPQPSRNLTGPLSQDGQTPSASCHSSRRVSNNQMASCPPAVQVESPLPGGQSIVSQTQPTGLSGGLDENGLLQCTQSLSPLNPPTRTFTKVYKLGSIGRSVDVTRFSGYHELRSELACMFGLEGQLEDPCRSGWQLVFVDKENDVLLLGDDPWEEFVNSVRSIRILSPPEVLQMTQEGMEWLNSISVQQQTSSSSEECVTGQDSRNISSCITSDRSLDY